MAKKRNGTTVATKRRRGSPLARFIYRSIAFAAILHYSSLVLLYHGFRSEIELGGSEILAMMDLPKSEELQVSEAEKIAARPLRALWAIHSMNSDEEKQRRQVLRETYLAFKHPNHQTGGVNLFCSLLDVGRGGLNNTDGCVFFYAFVIREPVQETLEPDVLAWNQSLTLRRWFQYVQVEHGRNMFDFFSWVDSNVIIHPLEIIDTINPLIGTRFFAQAPDTPIRNSCGGTCAWDREAALRRGRLTMMSTKVPPSVLKDKEACSFAENVDMVKAMQVCLQQGQASTPKDETVEMHKIGHQYSQPDMKKFQTEWQDHLKHQQAYRRFHRKHAIHYISGKFNRDPKRFTDEFHDLRTAMVHWGLQQDQIYLYDGVFPDFILEDHRWEQHIEFLYDQELSDKGAGYWFWKAPLVEHHLNMVNDGDFVIFGNVGFWDHFPWLLELLETMMSRQANFAAYHNFFPENEWTKRELYDLLCSHITERFLPNDRSNQYTGHFFVLRKSPGVMDLIRNYAILGSNYHLLSDEGSVLPEYPEFKEHRRDQSILSLLLKCRYGEAQKQLFSHPRIRELGWFDAFTFHLDPIAPTT